MGCVGASTHQKYQLKPEKPTLTLDDDLMPHISNPQTILPACGYKFQIPQIKPRTSSPSLLQSQEHKSILSQFEHECTQCEHYYQEHDLDNAIIHARNVRKFIENNSHSEMKEAKNVEKVMELVKRVEIEYNEVEEYSAEIKKDGWVEKSNRKGVKISTREETDKTVGVKIQSVIDIPFEIFISVLIEMDLYKDFVPFIKMSRFEKSVSRNCRIGYAQTHFPILAVRQAFFQGIGYNRLHKNNTLFLYTRSLHNRPDLQELFDYKCDVNKKYVQLLYKYFVVIYEPIDEKRGSVILAMNVDIGLNFLPLWILNKISQDFGQQFFSNLIERSKSFKGSKWEKNVDKNPQVFLFFRDALRNHLATRENRDD